MFLSIDPFVDEWLINNRRIYEFVNLFSIAGLIITIFEWEQSWGKIGQMYEF